MFDSLKRRGLAGTFAVIGISASLAGSALASDAAGSMEVNGWANPPVGHVAFCNSFPAECLPRGHAGPASLTESQWRDLHNVNLAINHAVAPATDLDIYRSEEVWTLPADRGDCEDYVLLKRKVLVEGGWPTAALLVGVVFDEVGDGHAVLIARTTSGDFVLDNKTDEIRLWSETDYRYVKRQSDADPRRWVSVGDPGPAARSTAAPR